MALVITLLVAGTMLLLLWLKFLPGSRIGKWSMFKRAGGGPDLVKAELLHCSGVAITQLRPSGAAFINGKRVEVVTEGSLIDRGAPIKVIAVEGARVVVREMT